MDTARNVAQRSMNPLRCLQIPRISPCGCGVRTLRNGPFSTVISIPACLEGHHHACGRFTGVKRPPCDGLAHPGELTQPLSCFRTDGAAPSDVQTVDEPPRSLEVVTIKCEQSLVGSIIPADQFSDIEGQRASYAAGTHTRERFRSSTVETGVEATVSVFPDFAMPPGDYR